jgi:hypothetical protein
MKIAARVSIVVATLLCFWTVGAGAETELSKLTAQESSCLAKACQITSLMNEDKWDEVEKALGPKDGMVAILRQHAGLKDWSGIGAYRGARLDKESPRTIVFRFGLGPRSSPHEIGFTYTFTESGPSKPSLMVLGW